MKQNHNLSKTRAGESLTGLTRQVVAEETQPLGKVTGCAPQFPRRLVARTRNLAFVIVCLQLIIQAITIFSACILIPIIPFHTSLVLQSPRPLIPSLYSLQLSATTFSSSLFLLALLSARRRHHGRRVPPATKSNTAARLRPSSSVIRCPSFWNAT